MTQELQTISQNAGTETKPVSRIRILLSGLLCCAIALLMVEQTFAAGTPAGTVITNFATMSYKDLQGNTFPSFNSDTVTTTILQLAGVAVTPQTASQSSSDSSEVKYPVTVTNTGNATDMFTLSRNSTQNWNPRLYHDVNRNGVLDSVERAGGTVSATDSLAADSSYYLVGVIFVPYNILSNVVDVLTVTATSNYTNSTSATGTYTTTIAKATLTLSKTQSAPNPSPGQVITYTLGYHNTGTGTAVNAVLSDVLNADVTFVNSSIVVPNGQNGSYNSNNRTVTWTIGNVSGGGTGTMTFQVTINDSVPAGTVISNVASVAYTDSLNDIPSNPTSSPTTTVPVVHSVTYTAGVSPQSKIQDVGLSVIYPITLTNTGNDNDSMRISKTTSDTLSWTYWIDNNNDGIPGNDGDYTFTSAHTPSFAQNSVLHILAVDTLPVRKPDGRIDTTSFTFHSLSDTTVMHTVVTYTTMRAPKVVMTKTVSVLGGGASVPGATLVYTITYQNNGTGAADSVVVSDAAPANTTYIANSVSLNSNAQTDTADGDGTTVSGGLVIVRLGTVASSGSGTITFKVKIN